MDQKSFLSVARKILYAYEHASEPLLTSFDLPRVSFDILMFLANHPECSTAKEICEIRRIKKNLVSVHVEKLVEADLLQRSEVKGDRRKVCLTCTEKAAPIIRAGQDMQKKFYESLAFGIAPEKWKIYDEILMTVVANAERLGRA